jgi:hypothetical protein
MPLNYIVAYDLMAPGQHYNAVISRIKSLGITYQIQFSLFYLSSTLPAEQIHASIRQVMDTNDRLAVITANSVYMTPHAQSDIDAINKVWFAKVA